MESSTPPARTLYESLSDWAALEQLIADGEAEGQFLECKSPSAPHIGQELRSQAARAASAFANSGGGVVIWGIGTSNRLHSGLDVLLQIEPIGHVRQFEQRLTVLLPRLTRPALTAVESRIVKSSPRDSKGVPCSVSRARRDQRGDCSKSAGWGSQRCSTAPTLGVPRPPPPSL
jgi:hypothetical protein